jgi:hypothetical protein
MYFPSACDEYKSIAAMPQLLLEMNEKSCDCRPSVVAVHGDLIARFGRHSKVIRRKSSNTPCLGGDGYHPLHQGQFSAALVYHNIGKFGSFRYHRSHDRPSKPMQKHRPEAQDCVDQVEECCVAFAS